MADPISIERLARNELGMALNRVNFEPVPERAPGDELITPGVQELADAAAEGHAATGQYRITYTRVGRRRDIPPLTVWAATADHLAELIEKDVSPYLLSSWPEVSVDLEEMRGFIHVGFNSGGKFTVELLSGVKPDHIIEQDGGGRS